MDIVQIYCGEEGGELYPSVYVSTIHYILMALVVTQKKRQIANKQLKSISWLRWFILLIRMPPGCLTLEVFKARPTGKRPYRQTQNMLERLYISSDLATPQDPPGRVACYVGGGHLEHLPDPAATVTLDYLQRWMEDVSEMTNFISQISTIHKI